MIISLLQWNIWYKEDIRNIAKFLREHPADIICLQELTIQDIPETGYTPGYIAEQLGYNYYAEMADVGAEDIPVGNGIFSKFPIVGKRTVWINEARGSGSYDDQFRVYLEAVLQVGDKTLTVGTVHMSYTKAFTSTPRKEHEADKLVDALRAHTQNFIFTGDLNAEPGSSTIQKISSVLKNIGPDMTEPTWTTKPFSYDGFEADELKYRLDYIFATADVKVSSTEILSTEFSDHLPVRVEVEMTS